jgi:hypothetical protein
MKRKTPLKRKKRLNPISKSKHRREARFIPKAVRKEVEERSQWQCEFVSEKQLGAVMLKLRCQNPANDLHHLLPKGRGGKNTVCNLMHLCREHHRIAHDNPKEAKRLGILK